MRISGLEGLSIPSFIMVPLYIDRTKVQAESCRSLKLLPWKLHRPLL